MNNDLLSVEHLNFSVKNKKILDDISLEISSPEFICFLGPSGCGKTTLLNMIAGFDQPTSGRIKSSGKDITKLSVTARQFGMVFQNYALFPNLTVNENIAFGLKKISKDEKQLRCQDLLKLVDLVSHANKLPSQLSGGQQQRVALARALAPKPNLLLLDEPLSALDAKIRVQLRNELRLLQKELNIPIIMVTHDQEEAMAVSDRIVLMNEGKIEQIGTPEQLYFQPKSEFVANFIGSVNTVSFSEWNQGAQTKIRYEHLWVESANETILDKNDAIIFQVIDTRFMGAFYRLTLLYSDQKSIIYADVPHPHFHSHQLSKEKFVTVSPKKAIKISNG